MRPRSELGTLPARAGAQGERALLTVRWLRISRFRERSDRRDVNAWIASCERRDRRHVNGRIAGV
jgi:hypothetical protein